MPAVIIHDDSPELLVGHLHNISRIKKSRDIFNGSEILIRKKNDSEKQSNVKYFFPLQKIYRG